MQAVIISLDARPDSAVCDGPLTTHNAIRYPVLKGPLLKTLTSHHHKFYQLSTLSGFSTKLPMHLKTKHLKTISQGDQAYIQ